MKIKNLLAAVACFAWAGAALSYAAPAHAIAVTQQSYSEYATCAGFLQPQSNYMCGTQLNYMQMIRLVSVACSNGSCGSEYTVSYVEFIYGTGRKQVSYWGDCGSGWYGYSLGTCAC
jgi:hypothetical protein